MIRADVLTAAGRYWRGTTTGWPHDDPEDICGCAPHTWARHMPCAACAAGRSCPIRELAEAAARDVPPEQLVLPLDVPHE
jgi:hypothetical protein